MMRSCGLTPPVLPRSPSAPKLAQRSHNKAVYWVQCTAGWLPFKTFEIHTQKAENYWTSLAQNHTLKDKAVEILLKHIFILHVSLCTTANLRKAADQSIVFHPQRGISLAATTNVLFFWRLTQTPQISRGWIGKEVKNSTSFLIRLGLWSQMKLSLVSGCVMTLWTMLAFAWKPRKLKSVKWIDQLLRELCFWGQTYSRRKKNH